MIEIVAEVIFNVWLSNLDVGIQILANMKIKNANKQRECSCCLMKHFTEPYYIR